MKKRLIISLILFLFLIYGIVINQSSISIIAEDLEPKNSTGWFDYKGISNVHTVAHLGSGTYNEVLKAAQEADLNFILFSDLNDFKRDLSIEGYHRNTLALVGSEVGYLDSRILIYDSLQRVHSDSIGEAQSQMVDLLSREGEETKSLLLVLAHPFKQGYSWIGDVPSGLDGVEIINLKDIWQKSWLHSKLTFLWSALLYPFNPRLALIRLYEEPYEALQFWDQVHQQRKFVGMSGAEATAKSGPDGEFSFRFPSYLTSFEIASNHLLLQSELTGNADRDRVKVMNALANGNFYMALDVLGNSKGFTTYLQSGDSVYSLGNEVEFKGGMRISISLPKTPKVPFEFVVYKDGQSVMSANSSHTEFVVHGPGVYRVAVRVFVNLSILDGHQWMTWIYTNPFYIRESGTSTTKPRHGGV